MSGRRPNAGGGRRNQPRSNVATRARFSNWRPPSKDLKKKFESKRSRQPARDHENEISMQSHVVQCKASYGGQKIEDIEKILMSRDFLVQLNRLLDDIPPEPPLDDDITDKKISKCSSDSSEKHILRHQSPLDDSKGANHSGKKIGCAMVINSTLMNKLTSLGFIMSEINAVADATGLCKTIRFNHDEDALILNLIRYVLGDDLLDSPPFAGIGPRDHSHAALNENLQNEIEALNSIYGDVDALETFFLHSVPCKILIVSLSDTSPPIRIKLLVYDTEHYLEEADTSRIYGWILSSAMPLETSRDLSIRAMLHMKTCDPSMATCFEFILYIQSHRDNNMSNVFNKNLSADSGGRNDRLSLSLKKSDTKAVEKEIVVVSADPVPAASTVAREEATGHIPAVPVISALGKFTNLPEYRQALLDALNSGLTAQDARNKARRDLEFILPSSTLLAIEEEERILEDLRNRKFKLAAFGTRGDVLCSKMLSSKTDLNKAKCKAWLAKAKESLEASDSAHAKDENTMAEKWVTEALRLINEREKNVADKKKAKKIEKVEMTSTVGTTEKSEQAMLLSVSSLELNNNRRVEKGPTIRESYDIAAEKSAKFMNRSDEWTPEPFSSSHFHDDGRNQKISEFIRALDESLPVEVETAECSLVNDPAVNRRLFEDLQTKRSRPIYRGILSKREHLPAYKLRSKILSVINDHRVTVVSGDTGCGKTTQIPQLVLDDYIDRGIGTICNIIVTQPRRISAISVAERIAQERTEKVGQTAGYNIRLETKRSEDTRILLVTTGVLLRRMLIDRSLSDVTHIFVDEVHERDINTDFLLIVLKLLLDIRPDLKVILMSATLNAQLFESYFRSYGAAAVSIPGRAFPVTTHFLEEALEFTGFDASASSNPDILQKSSKSTKGGSSISDGDMYCGSLSEKEYIRRRMVAINNLRSQKAYPETVLRSLEILNESVVNVELICSLIIRIMSSSPHGGILVFVPGYADIKNIIEALLREPMSSEMCVLPLHSSLSTSEQNRVFNSQKKGLWKVVVSTNIAETSITIEDILYVIDTCRTKENRYDEINQVSVLEDTWASKANARQRQGRAGRVRSGVCYHLTSHFTHSCLLDYAVPEILRLGLEELVLQILALDLGDPFRFLLSAISPPTLPSIRHAVNYLDSIGAVSLGEGHNIDGDDDNPYVSTNITPLGYHLAILPVNPRIGKLMLFGVLLRCIDPILTIAAFSSVKSPFVSSFHNREESDAARRYFLSEESDLITMLNAYNAWRDITESESRKNKRSAFPGTVDEFCSRFYLSFQNLKQIQQIRGQFIELLRDIGFLGDQIKVSNIRSSIVNSNGDKMPYIKSALCAGMTPNIAVALRSAGQSAPKRTGSSGLIAGVPATKTKLSDTSFSCSGGSTIFLHPSSVLFDDYIDNFRASYYMYLDAVRTSKVYARDFTKMNALTLVLFGGKVRSVHAGVLLELNDWIYFRADPQLVDCVIYLRDLMDRVFLEKVLNPQLVDNDMPHVLQMHRLLNIFLSSS